jgi:hypothetical protein
MTIKPAVVLLALLLLLAPVIAAELSVRALIAGDRLTEAPGPNMAADVSLANLQRLGAPDVLVVGTSSIRNALKPATLEKAVLGDTGREIDVRGVAQGGLSLSDQRVMVRGLEERGLLPDTVVLGLSPGSVTGVAHRWTWFQESELGRLWSGCADLDGVEALGCRLGQNSALWRWRGRPDRLVEAGLRGMPSRYRFADHLLGEDGWTSDPPATARRLKRQLPSTVAKIPADVPHSEPNKDDFVALVEELRSYGVHVVAVALPYAPPLEEALLQTYPAWRQELEAGYAGLAAAADIEIVEVKAFDDWWEPGSSNDLRHLSREGAPPLTRQLWEMPEFRESLLEGLTAAD